MIMDYMGRGRGPGTFQKEGGAVGTSQGFSSNMADQKVSLSPHQIGRSQFVMSWFPVVSPDHAGSLQERGT